jgi:hypothetical protein
MVFDRLRTKLVPAAGLLAVAAIGATALGAGNTALAADTTVVVTPEDVATQPENTPPTGNWVFYVRLAATGQFVPGPETPPIGQASFQIDTPTGADKGTLFNFDHVGTPLAEVDAISYSTYRTAGSAQQVAALNIQVDVNGAAPGGFTTLVFEPVYNTDQGAVVSGEWQDWDAYNGGDAIWWSSNPIPGAPNRDTFVSWDTIVAANPDAVILGGFGVNQGSGNPALTTAVDALTLGYNGDTITYNFEEFVVATSADQCKKGGWEDVTRANGTPFKNQGDCVSFTKNGK